MLTARVCRIDWQLMFPSMIGPYPCHAVATDHPKNQSFIERVSTMRKGPEKERCLTCQTLSGPCLHVEKGPQRKCEKKGSSAWPSLLILKTGGSQLCQPQLQFRSFSFRISEHSLCELLESFIRMGIAL